MKNTKIIIIAIIIILLIIFIFYINYYYGKKFKLCKECNRNSYYFIDIELPTDNIIKDLLNYFDENGSILDSNKNFNSANGKKINYNKLPKYIINYYENLNIEDNVSEILGSKVTFSNEKYKIFSRLYKKGDFLDWHYDNNFTMDDR